MTPEERGAQKERRAITEKLKREIKQHSPYADGDLGTQIVLANLRDILAWLNGREARAAKRQGGR